MREGWNNVKLTDVCRLINGRAYKKNELLLSGRYPVLRVGNFFTNQSWYYSDLELDSDKYCDNGDLLYAWSASFGPRIWEGGKVIFHYHIWKVEFDQSRIDRKFLYYWFDWDKEKIKKEQGVGTTMIHVTKGAMEQRAVDLPPLPEQKRIVAILDEAFAGIATAVANTEKNLANARELFESYLNAVFSQRNKTWTKRELGQLADFKNGLNFTKNSCGESVRIVGVKNFKSNYWVPTDFLEEVEVEGSLPIGYELKKNDILIVRSNGNKQLIGRCLLAGDVLEKTSHSGFTIRARLKRDELHPEFLMHYLRTGPIREQLVASGDGANISSLNQRGLATLTVRYPAPDEQLEIVRKIQEIDTESKQLGSTYQDKFNALAELKQSLLQKAFSGELTAGKAASDAVRQGEEIA
ncbi:restriction endonuclease subunit S [Thioalkalivibrio sp. ALMg13-2]|uniref:restriction endonuclease subunit S n=1 Tax=Thioalkalivibrio sp. ALMg13-2 TaxID=1158167 RepID=UPI0003639B90|nr:restriction endonuclease subunit S [Thioalkalivibrio sp. ALMg13-2]